MIQLFGGQISILELIGTLFGIAGVWLTVKENKLCFPFGIVNVALYAWLFFQSKLYADASLQLVYIILLVYGWFTWTSANAGERQLAVTRMSKNENLISIVVVIAATGLIGALFRYNTDAAMPFVDSFTTSMSLLAQWMIAKKKIENWLIWIVADIIYIGMYVYKHLFLTSVLYFIFILIAIKGWQEWKKHLSDVTSAATKEVV